MECLPAAPVKRLSPVLHAESEMLGFVLRVKRNLSGWTLEGINL